MFRFTVETKGFTDIIDITSQVESQLKGKKIATGVVILFVSGSTAALTTIEYEPGLIKDLKDVLEKIIPQEAAYAHNQKWGDGNGFAHLRASLIGPSLAIPIENNRLALGTWQQIVLLDFDNRPRRRQILGVVEKEG